MTNTRFLFLLLVVEVVRWFNLKIFFSLPISCFHYYHDYWMMLWCVVSESVPSYTTYSHFCIKHKQSVINSYCEAYIVYSWNLKTKQNKKQTNKNKHFSKQNKKQNKRKQDKKKKKKPIILKNHKFVKVHYSLLLILFLNLQGWGAGVQPSLKLPLDVLNIQLDKHHYPPSMKQHYYPSKLVLVHAQVQ